MAARAGGGKCGGDFLADQAGLSHSRNDHTTRAVEDQFDGLTERGIDTAGDLLQSGSLAMENLLGKPNLIEGT